jgi:hypothetical protein
MVLEKSELSIKSALKAKIIDVLGEEMYNFCLENPGKATAFSWLLSFSIADFDKANGINSRISNIILQVKEELGEELCIWYVKNHQGLIDIQIILNTYVNSHENVKNNQERFNKLLETIDSNNYKARIVPLISAFEAQDETNRLLEFFERTKINNVYDLLRLSSFRIDEKDYVQLDKFINWLSEDKKAILRNELHNLSKRDRDEAIIRKRAKGASLVKTSKDYAITHEGIRQIEKRYQERFNRYVIRLMPHYILYAFSKNISYISVDDIIELLGDSADIFIYCLKKGKYSTAHWSNELNGFIIGDIKWYEQLKVHTQGLPKMLYSESLDELIVGICENLGLSITFEDTKRFVLVDYTLSGKVYLKKRMSLSQMYNAVLKKYYPEGINLYDDTEVIRFRNYVCELFGDVYIPERNRAIEVRLTEITILCDRGKRILPSGVEISTELLRKIHDEIVKSNRNEITFSALFERFKNELLKDSNITNKYFLQGVLKLNYSNEFNITRYTVKKDLSCSSSQSKNKQGQISPVV